MSNITYVSGDVLEAITDSIKIIPHICNDVGAWGKGFVKALSAKWQSPEQRYRSWKDRTKLTSVDFIQVEDDTYVVNMIAQHGIFQKGGLPPIRYEALKECLLKVNEFCNNELIIKHPNKNVEIHAPKFGSGLAGGDWQRIEQIILETIQLNVFIYKL